MIPDSFGRPICAGSRHHTKSLDLGHLVPPENGSGAKVLDSLYELARGYIVLSVKKPDIVPSVRKCTRSGYGTSNAKEPTLTECCSHRQARLNNDYSSQYVGNTHGN